MSLRSKAGEMKEAALRGWSMTLVAEGELKLRFSGEAEWGGSDQMAAVWLIDHRKQKGTNGQLWMGLRVRTVRT